VYQPSGAPELAEIAELRRQVAELEAENAELLVLQQVFSTINSTLNVEDILSTVLRGIHVALHFQRAILFDVEDGTLRRRLETDHKGNAARPESVRGCTGGAAIAGLLQKEQDFFVGKAGDEEAPVDDPVGAYCIVPLVSRGSILGILYADSATGGELRENSIRVLLDFAAQAAVAIEHAALYSEAKRLLEETQRLASTDPLTGLSNRRALEELLEHAIHNAMRHHQQLLYAIFDLDDLKQINDTEGHAGGDRALRDLAQVLKSVSRKGDIVARYGGDEFIVVMTQTDRTAGEAAFARFEERFRAKRIRCSIGAAMLPADASDAAGLFTAADAALYEAKRRGKNRFVFYDRREKAAQVLARD
jgi:diguanylate cyclase (GGDEF)-like protein